MSASLRPCGAGVAACTSASDPIAPSAAAPAVTDAACRNSRRLRYSFLSVISELRISDARLISIGSLYEPTRLLDRFLDCRREREEDRADEEQPRTLGHGGKDRRRP